MLPCPTRSRPASRSAFSSACMQRHLSKPFPHGVAALHRLHPPSLQLVRFFGVPLYPVAITRFSRTRTHPTRRFMQFDRLAARLARYIKYESQLGRSKSGFVMSNDSSARHRVPRSDEWFKMDKSLIDSSLYAGVNIWLLSMCTRWGRSGDSRALSIPLTMSRRSMDRDDALLAVGSGAGAKYRS